MKRTVIGILAALTFATGASGCGSSSNEESSNKDTASQSAAPQSEEKEAAADRAAMDPDEFGQRLLNAEDLSSDYTLDDEVTFGEQEEQSSNVFDTGETEHGEPESQFKCASDAFASQGPALDGVTAVRSFMAEHDNAHALVASTLSRPDKGADTTLKEIRAQVEKCASVAPQEMMGSPLESMTAYAPDNAKGEGTCFTSYTGSFESMTVVYASCYIAWAGELMTVHDMTFKQTPTPRIDEEAIDGVTERMRDSLLPAALAKADLGA